VGFRDFEDAWISDAWTDPFLRGAWLIHDAGGEPAAYVELESVEPSTSIDSWAAVHPRHRDGPLRSELLRFIEDQALSLTAGEPTSLLTSGTDTDPSFPPAASAAGFRHVRTFWHMERPVDASYRPEPPPAGVDVRAMRGPDDEHRVFEVMDEAFRGHFGHVPMDFEGWRRMHAVSLADPSLVLLAWSGDGVTGAVTARVPGGQGWVDDLGVRAAFRGRGIGAALLRAAFAALAARGVDHVRLNVDADNETGATRLYASVGMTVRRAFLVYEKRLDPGVSSAP
jgi:mycothiol synthase